jgi:hypothetical protein
VTWIHTQLKANAVAETISDFIDRCRVAVVDALKALH